MSKTTSNLSDLARELGISREAVRRQIKNRERTGAPLPDESGAYDIDGYKRWYAEDFKPRTGPKAGIRAEASEVTSEES